VTTTAERHREAYAKGYLDGVKDECARWREIVTRWAGFRLCDAPTCGIRGEVTS
jgi:hypothetical protein